MSGTTKRDHHSVRNAMLMAALAGLATAFRRDWASERVHHVPRIGETALGEPGEVLWYC
ncbi:MAG: hypothetical protein U0Q22_09620 [Acidimicrobiales bacterium]